jgi:hypothetical protein
VRLLHIRVAESNPQWILERRHPDVYGPPKLRTETELSGPGGAPISVSHFTVIINCSGEAPEFPVVDSETGLPVPENENPYSKKLALR